MPYCTQNDIETILPRDRLVELTDDSPSPSIVDPVNLAAAITKADTTIDGYIAGKVTLPLDPVPPIINVLSTQIATYHIWTRRPEMEAPKDVVRKFDAAMTMLKDIAKGLVSLGVDQPSLAPGEYKTNKTSRDRIFGPGTLGRF